MATPAISFVSNFADETVTYPRLEEVERHPTFPGWTLPCQYFELIDSPEEFYAVVEELKQASAIAIDTETEGLGKRTHRMIGLSFTYRKDFGPLHTSSLGELRNVYVPIAHVSGQPNIPLKFVRKALVPILQDPKKTWVMWFEKFDFHMLENEQFPIPRKHIDGQIVQKIMHVNDPSGLKKVASGHFQEVDKAKSLLKTFLRLLCQKNGWSFKQDKRSVAPSYYEFIPTPVMAAYSARDTYYTWQITANLLSHIQNHTVSLLHDHLRFSKILYAMERFGLHVNLGKIHSLTCEFEKIAQMLANEIEPYGPPGFRLQSDESIEALFLHLNIPKDYVTPKSKDKPWHEQRYALDKVSLMRLAQKGFLLAETIQLWREYTGYLNRYLYPWPRMIESTGCLHTTFFTVGTKTCRVSSARPNLQNIPARSEIGRLLRECFEIPPRLRKDHWVWVFLDLSQVELRLLAHLSLDPLMLKAFRENQDIHAMTAYFIFKERFRQAPPQERKELRRIAKEINFSIIYGLGVSAFRDKLFLAGVRKNHQECDVMMKQFKQTYHVAIEWAKHVTEQAQREGFISNELFYFRPLPELNAHTPLDLLVSTLREIPNAIIQSTAAILFKQSCVAFHDLLEKENIPVHWVNCIHDELQVLVPPKHYQTLLQCAHHAFERFHTWCSVPLLVNVQWSLHRWSDKKEGPLPPEFFLNKP